ncbi:RNA ligase 2 protein [Rhizobium phage RHph_I1_18]|nr:RNA ligase 2 protein [Rhizobium phage RHph_I1_18]
MRKYTSIEQFRNVIKDVQHWAKVKNGLRDEEGNLILAQPKTWLLPKLTFKGTVKLHGSNASIVISDGSVGYQSRNRTLTIESDNAGFALWASQYNEIWRLMADDARLADVDNVKEVVIFGEWCGGNIQKGVAITGLNKMFVIFEVWLVTEDDKTFYFDIDTWKFGEQLNEQNIWLITQFPTYELEIDFERPELAQNQLIDITMAVEKECPVGKHFGVSGVGEGVVWHHDINPTTRLRFKVKGTEHQSSRVTTLAPVDVEKINAVSEFVSSVLTESRLNQGLDHLREFGKELSVKSTGDYVKWVSGDVFKEERDTIVANQLDAKVVGKHVATEARKWFFEKVM